MHLKNAGNSLVVQWLGLCIFTAKGLGSIFGWETKIPQIVQCCEKKKDINVLMAYIIVQLIIIILLMLYF